MKLGIEDHPNDGTPWDLENKTLFQTISMMAHSGGGLIS
jgi:hypothetical protein